MSQNIQGNTKEPYIEQQEDNCTFKHEEVLQHTPTSKQQQLLFKKELYSSVQKIEQQTTYKQHLQENYEEILTPIINKNHENLHFNCDHHGESPFRKFCKGLSPITQSPNICRNTNSNYILLGSQNYKHDQKYMLDTPSNHFSKQYLNLSPTTQKNARPNALRKIVEKLDLSGGIANENICTRLYPQFGNDLMNTPQPQDKIHYRHAHDQNLLCSETIEQGYYDESEYTKQYTISTATPYSSQENPKFLSGQQNSNNNFIKKFTQSQNNCKSQHYQHRKQLFSTPSHNSNNNNGEMNKEQETIKKYNQEFLLNSTPSKKIGLNKINSFKIDQNQSVEQIFGENNTNSNHKKDEESSNTKKRRISCNCKKSRCLKLYCDCFKEGLTCKDCNCIGCANTEDNLEEREHVLNSLLARSPEHQPGGQQAIIFDEDRNTVRHKKGCHCKKSGCVKKYCECYQLNVKCTDLCKCEGCKNCNEISEVQQGSDRENSEYRESVQLVRKRKQMEQESYMKMKEEQYSEIKGRQNTKLEYIYDQVEQKTIYKKQLLNISRFSSSNSRNTKENYEIYQEEEDEQENNQEEQQYYRKYEVESEQEEIQNFEENSKNIKNQKNQKNIKSNEQEYQYQKILRSESIMEKHTPDKKIKCSPQGQLNFSSGERNNSKYKQIFKTPINKQEIKSNSKNYSSHNQNQNQKTPTNSKQYSIKDIQSEKSKIHSKKYEEGQIIEKKNFRKKI